jgi:hypothetical protein
MMRSSLFVFLGILILTSCDPQIDRVGVNQAYVPVYAQLSGGEPISLRPPQSTAKAGKIYAYGSYIFQNDVYNGVHIIDNSTPGNPKKVAFLKIPYSTELAIKGSYLYTNSINDLVVVDIHDPQHPVEVKRIKGAFPLINQEYPPYTNVYFVCADPQQGIVVDWQLQQMPNLPSCRR